MALAELWSDLVDTLLPTASAEEEVSIDVLFMGP